MLKGWKKSTSRYGENEMKKTTSKGRLNIKAFKVLITGARTTLNNGTMSIVVSGIEALNELLGNVEFTICSSYTTIDTTRYYNTLSSVCKARIIGVPYYHWLPYPFRATLVLIRSIPEYFSTDIIIDMRGEGFKNTRVAIFQSVQLLLGVLLRKPVVVYAQSLGPFRSKVNKILAKFTLKKIDLITIREPVSMVYFRNLGIGKQAYLCGDQAFLLDPAPAARIKEILAEESISDRDKPLIGISPIPNDKLMNLIVKTTEYLIENLGATVIYIAHAIDAELGNDDISACRIYQQINNRPKTRLISTEYTPKELKGIMSQCDMYITCRWHAGIAATSMHVPTIILSSAHKSAAMDMIDQEKFVIDPEHTDFSELRSKIDFCWLNKDKIRKKLEDNMKGMRKSAMLSAELTAQLLKRNK